MSAAAERATLAATARGLLAGEAGERRARALLPVGDVPPPIHFATIAAAPDWLGWPHARQCRLAEAVALRTMAATLARSIDGAWLRALAERAGEKALDWAIARGEGRPVEPAVAALALDRLAARGFAALRASLSPPLAAYTAWAPDSPGDGAAPEAVTEAVAFMAEDGAE